MVSERSGNFGRLTIGGLYLEDFEYAVRFGSWIGKPLVAFRRAPDGSHWEAVYDGGDRVDR